MGNKGKDKGKLGINSLILAVGIMGSKIIGVFYRIPLVNLLGAEGIGVYQQIYAVFAFLLTLISSAIPVAVARLVSEKIATGDEIGAYQVFKNTKKTMLLVGLIASTIIYVSAYPLALIQGNIDIELGYYAIAPSLIIVAVISAYRGYYQGLFYVKPTAISQIIEQVVKLTLGLYLANLLSPMGIIYAVSGALLGVTFSEIVTLMYFYLKYKRDKKKIEYDKNSYKIWDKELMRIVLPMTFASIIIPLTQLIDSVLIVSVLNFRGIERGVSTSYYGLLTGAVSTIVNMPVVLALSVAIAAVPILCGLKARHELDLIKSKSRISIKSTYAIGVFFAFLLYLSADFILRTLFPSLTAEQLQVAGGLLKVSGIGIIFITQLQIQLSVLQALGKLDEPIFNLLVAAVIKIILTIVLAYYFSIIGAAIASVASFFIGSILNNYTMIRYMGKDKELFISNTKVLLSGIIMTAVLVIITLWIENELIKFLIYAILGAGIYAGLLWFFKAFNRQELQGVPLVNKVIKKD